MASSGRSEPTTSSAGGIFRRTASPKSWIARRSSSDLAAFAGLYSGGTIPEYRSRGAYRALVAARAAVARRRGYRFLIVDARETSRPILQRLGFEPLATVRGWTLAGA